MLAARCSEPAGFHLLSRAVHFPMSCTTPIQACLDCVVAAALGKLARQALSLQAAFKHVGGSVFVCQRSFQRRDHAKTKLKLLRSRLQPFTCLVSHCLQGTVRLKTRILSTASLNSGAENKRLLPGNPAKLCAIRNRATLRIRVAGSCLRARSRQSNDA